jgi:hypothetical protein
MEIFLEGKTLLLKMKSPRSKGRTLLIRVPVPLRLRQARWEFLKGKTLLQTSPRKKDRTKLIRAPVLLQT